MIKLLLLLAGSYVFYNFTGNLVLFLFLCVASILLVLWGAQLTLASAKAEVGQAQGNVEDGFQKRHDVLLKVLDTVKSEMAKRGEAMDRLYALAGEKRESPKGFFGQATAQGEYEHWYQELRQEVMRHVTEGDERNAESHRLVIRSINDVEENLSAARRFYNSAVKTYNEKLEGFPTNVMARVKGYEPAAFFEVASEDIRKDVSITL